MGQNDVGGLGPVRIEPLDRLGAQARGDCRGGLAPGGQLGDGQVRLAGGQRRASRIEEHGRPEGDPCWPLMNVRVGRKHQPMLPPHACGGVDALIRTASNLSPVSEEGLVN